MCREEAAGKRERNGEVRRARLSSAKMKSKEKSGRRQGRQLGERTETHSQLNVIECWRARRQLEVRAARLQPRS